MPSPSPTVPVIARPSSPWWRWLAYVLAVVFLVYVLRDIRPQQALKDLRNIRWGWIVVGIVADLLSYVVQGERWRQLLTSFTAARLTQTVRAVYAGLFANYVLPLRSGELLRAFLISRDTHIGLTRAFTTVGLERLMDGVVLAAALGIVSLYVDFPGGLARAARIFGVVILSLSVLFIMGVVYLNLVPVLPEGAHPLRKRIRQKLAPFLEGVRVLGNSAGFYGAAAVSPLIPGLQVLALWAMGRGYGIGLDFWPMAAVLLIINFGVALPNAPANVGSYQFFCTLGLTLFGVQESRAAAFSIVVHLLFTLAFLCFGFLATLRSGLSFGTMRARVTKISGTPPPQAG
jgi:uncharacterized protein (TIRG00374 family)